MKHGGKILAITTFTLLAHYFVLTYFKVEGTESFIGKVEQIETVEKGLFPKANIKFEVVSDDSDDGEKKIVTKTISLIKNDLRKFKLGHSYKVKTHKHWLLTER